MQSTTVNWWESEDAPLHPTAPLPQERLYPERMQVPAELVVHASPVDVAISYELPIDLVSFEIEIHAGRLVVTSEGAGHSWFARAVTLPDNLDHQRVRMHFGRSGIELRYPFHPISAWRRRGRVFLAWLRGLWSRLLG